MSDEASLEFFDLNEVPNNSVIIVRVDVPGPMEKFIAAKNLYKLLYTHKDLLSGKHITILTMTPKEGIEVMTEKDMNNVGWFRKSKL